MGYLFYHFILSIIGKEGIGEKSAFRQTEVYFSMRSECFCTTGAAFLSEIEKVFVRDGNEDGCHL